MCGCRQMYLTKLFGLIIGPMLLQVNRVEIIFNYSNMRINQYDEICTPCLIIAYLPLKSTMTVSSLQLWALKGRFKGPHLKAAFNSWRSQRLYYLKNSHYSQKYPEGTSSLSCKCETKIVLHVEVCTKCCNANKALRKMSCTSMHAHTQTHVDI